MKYYKKWEDVLKLFRENPRKYKQGMWKWDEKKKGYRQVLDTKSEKKEGDVTEEIKEVKESGAWQVSPKGAYSMVPKTILELPAGEYSHVEDSDGNVWAKPSKVISDNLVDLPDLPTGFVMQQIGHFWRCKDLYEKYKFLQKRGIMFYGPAGCGKTSIVNLLKRQIVDMGGVVFTVGEDFETLVRGLKDFRTLEPDRPVMTVVEDIETYLESSNGSNVASEETTALSLYDGEDQINNVVHIATTNKPAAVADRFIRRPGRFDLVIGLNAPTPATRRAYLKSVCGENLSEEDLESIVKSTNGLSLAYMREIASTFLVLGIPLDETIKRLNKNKKDKFESAPVGYTVGFVDEGV